MIVFVPLGGEFNFGALLPKDNFLSDGTLERDNNDGSESDFSLGKTPMLLKRIDEGNDKHAVRFTLPASSSFDCICEATVDGRETIVSRAHGDNPMAFRVKGPSLLETE